MERGNTEQEGDDPASKAFAKLRREVAMMRLAMEKLTDEPAKLEIPDYTATLREMAAQISSAAKTLQAVRSSPALELTPEDITQQIMAARREAQDAALTSLNQATSALDKTTRSISGYVESARSADLQNKWMVGFGGLCFVLGAIAASVVMLS